MAWTFQYEANETPDNATPAWVITASTGTPTLEISPASHFHYLGLDSADNRNYTRTDALIDETTGVTLEFNIKINDSESKDAGDYVSYSAIILWANLKRIEFDLFKDGFEVYDGIPSFDEYVALNNQIEHTFRLTLSGSTLNVYVDGELSTTHTVADSVSSNLVLFENHGLSDSLIDYIYYRTDGAFAPGTDTASFMRLGKYW